jgi:ATPase subunit of ABC transporter with duplicated ATPase domains
MNARTYVSKFNFSGADQQKFVGQLSGGERNRVHLAKMLKTGANVLLLDEPTNNLDPASRSEILGALRNYTGAVVLVSHDEGAVEALNPERVVLLPDGVEDHWNEDYLDLITLA